MGGFFGTVSKRPCIYDLFYGTDYNSHLGTKRGGMATYNVKTKEFKRSIHNLENSYFRTRFEAELQKFEGNSGIGIISDTDAQPLLLNSHLGKFAIVTVAKIGNLEELAQHLLDEGLTLSEFSSGKINPTEIIGQLIVKGHNFVEGIENVFRQVKGSCSMLLLTEDGIIAARDSWGRTPIALGKREDAYALASETSSFPNLGFETEKQLGPGEILLIRENGCEQLRKPNPGLQICAFLWVYYGFPTSSYEGMNVECARNRCGFAMGKSDEVEVDYACGIPDSGIGMAVGYAAGHNVPYLRAINKYTPTWPRSFMPVSQETRDLVAKMKLIANKDILEGRKVLFCDDSIVRGTQLKDNTKVLTDLGAKEVHMRIACPPLLHACPFVNFSASKNEYDLITRRVIRDLEGDNCENLEKYATTGSPEYQRMVDEIARRLNLTSLKFSTLETLVESIGLPKCRICTHCFDGSSAYTLEQENK